MRTSSATEGTEKGLAAFFLQSMAMVRRHDGQVLQLPEGMLLAFFNQPSQALLAGLDLQKIWTGTGVAWGKVGIARGQGTLLRWPEGLAHCGGDGPELALRLSREAYAGVVLVADDALPENDPPGQEDDGAEGGWPLQRVAAVHGGEGNVIPCHAALPKAGHAAVAHLPGMMADPTGEERSCHRYFGQVVLVKEERGYGFLNFSDEHGHVQDLFFHISHVIDRLTVKAGQRVNFALRPGKGGRLQAQSVLLLGHLLHGQVDEASPAGITISLRDERSDTIRFAVTPGEETPPGFQPGVVVSFLAGERDDTLVAHGIQPFQGAAPPTLVGEGDNLELGSWEEGVIHEYFVDKGYGFIRCRRNEVYFHIAELYQPDQMPSRGERVEFRIAPGRNAGYRAVEIRFLTPLAGGAG